MINLTVKTQKTVDSEVVVPQFFTIGDYRHFKILDSKSYISVINYETDTESMNNLEVYPSIEVQNVRYLEYPITGRTLVEITEEEFNVQLKKCHAYIAKL